MAYRYRSRRSNRRLARNSRQTFILTIIIIVILLYATLTWVLPYFIGSISVVKNIIKPPKITTPKSSLNSNLAPPILNIPFESTNSAQINIRGFGVPNSKVILYIDNESNQTTDVSSDGSFTFEGIDLNLGTNNIYGTTLDEQNKESLPSKTLKLFFDNERPPLNLNEPGDNKTIQGGDKKVKVSGKTDPGTHVFINNSQIIVDEEGNFNTDIAINEGDNTLSIKAVDGASNSTEIQRNIKYNP